MTVRKQLCLVFLLVACLAHACLDVLAAPVSSSVPSGDTIDSVLDLPLGKSLVGHLGQGRVLQGGASVDRSVWETSYKAGCRYLSLRLYNKAEKNLQIALTKLTGLNKDEQKTAETKLALADSLLGQKKFARAGSFYTQSLSFFKKSGEAELPYIARALLGQGRCELALGNLTKASAYLSEALKIRYEKLSTDSAQYGLTLFALGECLAASGQLENAQTKLQESISILEKYNLPRKPEAGEAMLALAAVLEKQGDEKSGRDWADKGWEWKQKCVSLQESPVKKGPLAFRWQQGEASSHLIPDDSYPLKYMTLNGVRVAVTLVRNEHVISALISLANCSSSRQHLALGPVTLRQISPKDKELKYIHPLLLDMPLEEREVFHLTWRRSCLKHIQQTRQIPGYLQNGIMDTNNFFGNNTFGLYGHWDTLAYMTPPVVTREQFFFNDRPAIKEADLVRFLHGSTYAYQAAVLEPGEAKTGIVVFQFEPFTAAVLGVQIGSALYEFPFEQLRRPGL